MFSENVVLATTLAMVGKLGIAGAYGIINLISAEVFPTVVRWVHFIVILGISYVTRCVWAEASKVTQSIYALDIILAFIFHIPDHKILE